MDFDNTANGDDAAREYSRAVGRRLRTIRQQQRLSLLDVEQRSKHEFKASVLGAYERAERAVSVPRLDRLAAFYGVPIEQFLHRAVAPPSMGPTGRRTQPALTIDLERLAQMPGAPFETLTRFLRSIRLQRQDVGGDIVTVRSGDADAIAAMLGVSTDRLAERLAELGVLAVRGA
jgi:transcriptional regulator with XRE-family HTH domain